MVITDEKMPDLTGMELLSEIKKMDPGIPVILITAYGSVSMAVDALKKGAFYFFEKPIFNNLEQFFAIIRQALKTQEMEREINHLRKEVMKIFLPNIIGNHPKMQEVLSLSERWPRRIRPSSSRESGTGKDLIAKTIHYNSQRKDKPLVTVHCGALTDTLTSELFDTRKVPLRSHQDKIGRFQMADGGTLVLDEIGEVLFIFKRRF
jgi:DNA-binding NtrC family response regulator